MFGGHVLHFQAATLTRNALRTSVNYEMLPRRRSGFDSLMQKIVLTSKINSEQKCEAYPSSI